MLGLTQLCGFGAGGGSGAGGVLSAAFMQSVASTTIAETYLDFTLVDAVPYVNNKTYLVAMAADNAGTNGASCFQAAPAGFDESGSGSSVLFNPYRVDETRDPGVANAGVTLAAACGHYTGATGDGVLNVNYNLPYPTAKAAILLEISDTLGGATEYVNATSNAGNGTAPTVSATLLAGDMMVGLLASEGRVAPTADGSAGWSSRVGTIADTTVAGTSITMHAQTYVATVDETKTWSPTWSSARDYVIGAIVLRPQA